MRRDLLVNVICTLLSVGVINAAAAADLLVKAPVYAPPVLYNWSGLYLGANVGGAWSNRSIAGTALGDPFSTALIGGFQLGYNLQAGHFLAGVEGDFDWATFGHPTAPFSDQQKWISTVAARFGFASGRWLAYGKVGGGWAQDNAALTFPIDRATEGCVGLGDENPRRIIDAGDRDEVADRERELLDLRSKRVQVRVAEQHDVTVGGALEHVFGSDHTAAPRADHRDHRLAEMGLGGRGDDAGMEHVRAAERIRRDELQQLIGECTCGACQRQSSRRSGGKRSNRSAGCHD